MPQDDPHINNSTSPSPQDIDFERENSIGAQTGITQNKPDPLSEDSPIKTTQAMDIDTTKIDEITNNPLNVEVNSAHSTPTYQTPESRTKQPSSAYNSPLSNFAEMDEKEVSHYIANRKLIGGIDDVYNKKDTKKKGSLFKIPFFSKSDKPINQSPKNSKLYAPVSAGEKKPQVEIAPPVPPTVVIPTEIAPSNKIETPKPEVIIPAVKVPQPTDTTTQNINTGPMVIDTPANNTPPEMPSLSDPTNEVKPEKRKIMIGAPSKASWLIFGGIILLIVSFTFWFTTGGKQIISDWDLNLADKIFFWRDDKPETEPQPNPEPIPQVEPTPPANIIELNNALNQDEIIMQLNDFDTNTSDGIDDGISKIDITKFASELRFVNIGISSPQNQNTTNDNSVPNVVPDVVDIEDNKVNEEDSAINDPASNPEN